MEETAGGRGPDQRRAETAATRRTSRSATQPFQRSEAIVKQPLRTEDGLCGIDNGADSQCRGHADLCEQAEGCGAALAAIQAVGLLHLGWREQLSLERLGTVLLAFGYGAVIIRASDKAIARSLLAWAAPLGRMAFTNYLMQSVIFGRLFYGYGRSRATTFGIIARRRLFRRDPSRG
jgi:hypothetical protein